ncbi:hypothetical protein JW823_08785 [bacterium]|nr:hypothetical protein [candidate division CSSED10-310 bacterium]
MKNWMYILMTLVMVSGFDVFAEETKTLDSGWIDVTREVAANPADAGGWVKDETGKVFRSSDGNFIKIQHATFGVFKVDLPGAKVFRIDGDKDVLQDGSSLLQRDAGQTLVIKLKDYKFKVQFTEKIEGMKSIPGIKGM